MLHIGNIEGTLQVGDTVKLFVDQVNTTYFIVLIP